MMSSAGGQQARYDSNGKNVPLWEVQQVSSEDELTSPQKQQSWRIPRINTKSWPISKFSHGSGSVSSSSSSNSSPGLVKSDLWKPVSLKAPALGCLFVVTLGIIAILEYLSHLSSRNNNENDGGLAFADTVDDLSIGVQFVYFYLPTIIAVVYAMAWMWIDLDVKRLEPYFRMAKSTGASADDSILLWYQFQFPGFVPHRAIRRRHWGVFMSGVAILFIGIVLLPLQAAIFSTGSVNLVKPLVLVNTHRLASLAEQEFLIKPTILTSTYGRIWLNQTIPRWTTPDYVLMPFGPLETNSTPSNSETWSGPTTMFYSNLTCTPAEVIPSESNGRNTFKDEKCSAEIQMPSAPPSGNEEFAVLYVQWWTDQLYFLTDNWSRELDQPGCGDENSHRFLAMWAERNKIDGNWTNVVGQFCEPTYHSRSVVATVNASTSSVVDVEYDPNTEADIIGPDLVDIVNFERLIGTGALPNFTQSEFDREPYFNGHHHEVVPFEGFELMDQEGVVFPPSPMTPFGVGQSLANTVPVKNLRDPQLMADAFNRAHRVLFASLVNQVTLPLTEDEKSELSVTSAGTRTNRLEGVRFIRAFSLVVEAALAILAVLILALWLYYRRRPNKLTSDPGSISNVMQLIQSRQKVLDGFSNTDMLSEEHMGSCLQNYRYRLENTYEVGKMQMHLDASLYGNAQKDVPVSPSGPKRQGDLDSRPFEFTYVTAALSLLFILAVIGATTALYTLSVRSNGLRKPSDNEVVIAILTNLIPTALATSIEPFWTLLSRQLCILQPFETLKRRNSKPSQSIELRYTTIPSQLVFWPALKSGHLVLALVCAVALSTNILAVTLSGLFTEKLVPVSIPTTTTMKFEPLFNATPDFTGTNDIGAGNDGLKQTDSWYAVLANVSGEASLPPWTDTNNYYLPFDVSTENHNLDPTVGSAAIESYSAVTRGFGIALECRDPSMNNKNTWVALEVNNTETMAYRSFVQENGTYARCEYRLDAPPSDFDYEGQPNTRRLEWATSRYNTTRCQSQLVVAFARTTVNFSETNVTLSSNASSPAGMQSTVLFCQPKLKTAMYDVKVDSGARVLESRRVGNFTDDLSFLQPGDFSDPSFGNFTDMADVLVSQITIFFNRPKISYPSGRWMTGSLTKTWLASAIGLKRKSFDWFAIDSPPPAVADVIPELTYIYQAHAAVMMSFNKGLFRKANASAPAVPMTIDVREERIFMEPIMVYLSLGLLGIQLIALVIFYSNRPGNFLPRMPLSIASIIGYVANSHALRMVGTRAAKNMRLGYGEFLGPDGKIHVGIEREPLIPKDGEGMPMREKRVR